MWSSPQRAVQRCLRLLAFRPHGVPGFAKIQRTGSPERETGPADLSPPWRRCGVATPACPAAGLGRWNSSWQKAACSPQAESAATGRGLATRVTRGDCWCDGLFPPVIDLGWVPEGCGQASFRQAGFTAAWERKPLLTVTQTD